MLTWYNTNNCKVGGPKASFVHAQINLGYEQTV
jgi:hypothetical protein